MDDELKEHPTALVVDDEPLVRMMLGRYLVRDGYRVISATDGEQALNLAANEAGGIDVLVTDVALPGLDGRALSRAMRESYPGLRVVFVSGCVRPTDRYPLARSAVLAKPFDRETLRAAIDALA